MKNTSTACTIQGRAYQINGKDTFLYSGEVHYFRIPQRYWDRHLQALVDAGCNGVSTYVPWSWHEFKEGTTDLTGKTHPERDLVGFLDLAATKGLFVTVKPGPYIMAEATDQGIPRWLTDRYPETQCRRRDGQAWGADYVAYASDIVREKSSRWLTQFAKKIVLPRQNLKAGAIIQMQLCNEIGIYQWLGSLGDYSEANIHSWQCYLRREFKTPVQLSTLLDREVNTFEDLLPPHGPCTTRREYVLYSIWHDYYRWLYADYVHCIRTTLRNAGVTVPLFTNVGGWVYGRAHELPLNATFHRQSIQQNPDVFYGIDHIPEFVSSLNTHDGIVANQVIDELQKGQQPLYSAELQCGSREHGVQPYPGELALFYRQCLIHGLTGMNFYMFAQGKNPKGRGIDGPMFYWFTAVDYKGQRQEVYPTIQHLGEWLKHNGESLIHSRKPADLGLAFYPFLYESEFLYPKLQKQQRVDLDKLGISDPVNFRDRAFFDGVIRILVKKSIPYDLVDLTLRSASALQPYRSLVVLSNEMMDAETQQKLCDFVDAGGRLVIFPTMPTYDLRFNRCTVLEAYAGIQIMGKSRSSRIYMNQLKDIPVPCPPHILSGEGMKVLARTADKDVVGVEKKCGKGTIRYFGFHLFYTIEEHPDLWRDMMQFPEFARNAWADTDAIQLEARFHGKEGVLFVGNIHRSPIKAHVQVQNPADKKPMDLGMIALDALTGLLLPIHVKVSDDMTIAYAHGELLERTGTTQGASLILRGPAQSKGVIALISRKKIQNIFVDGNKIPQQNREKFTIANYSQSGERQVITIQYAM